MNFSIKKIFNYIPLFFLVFIVSCSVIDDDTIVSTVTETTEAEKEFVNIDDESDYYTLDSESDENIENNDSATDISDHETCQIKLDLSAPYATYSVINDGSATLYKADRRNDNYKNITIAVNAGHGTIGGSKFKTFSHPDFSPKVVTGTTKEGEVLSYAISEGTVFLNGMTEANANLAVAYALKDRLLNDGYSVLMIRTDDNCRLDNIARTVIANENADAHIAIHFDSTSSDKGVFYIAPYENEKYLSMEPLKSNAARINELGTSIIDAYKEMGEKVWRDRGIMYGDLTQISFSTNASVDIELGDKKTELTLEKLETLAEGLKRGIDKYFEK